MASGEGRNKREVYDLSVDWETREEGSEELLEAIPTELIGKKEELYRQGDPPVEFSVIKLGSMQVSKQSPDGSHTLLEIPGPGEPVGAMAVMNQFPYPATVVALKDTIVYRFSADLVPRIQSEAPRWFSEKLGEAARRIVDLADRLQSMTTRDVKSRLAEQLCQLADKYGEQTEQGLRIDTRVTRQMLADMVGCRVESAIRQLSHWEQKGIIKTDDSHITICNIPHLSSATDSS